MRFRHSEKFCLGGITSKVRRWLMTIALVVIGVGYSGSARAEYWPWHMGFNQRFIEAFKIDSVFEFPADEPSSGGSGGGTDFTNFMNKVKYQTCPNMMSVCMLTWSDASGQDDDYDMEWTELYLYNKASGQSKILCDIGIYRDGQGWASDAWLNVPGTYTMSERTEGNVKYITNYNGCETSLAYIRLFPRTGYETFAFLHIKYSEDVKNFMKNAGSNLQVLQKARFDPITMQDFEIYTDIKYNPIEVNFGLKVGQNEWIGEDQHQYTITGNTNCSEINTKVVKNAGTKNETVSETGWTTFKSSHTKKTTYKNLTYSQMLSENTGATKILYQVRKNYPVETRNWLNIPTIPTIESGWYTLYLPMFVKNTIDVSYATDGTNKCVCDFERSTIAGREKDESDFVLQRATDSIFTQNLVSQEIAYSALKWTKKDDSETSSCSYTDNFSDVYGQGNKTFYYRIRQKHSSWNDYYYLSSLNVNTNFQEIDQLTASVGADKKSFVLNWKRKTGGIWPEGVQYELVSSPAIPNLSNPSADTTSFTVTGIQACVPYTFTLKVKYDGKEVNSTLKKSVTIVNPNAEDGTILSLDVSKGYYKGRTSIVWTLDEGTQNFAYFNLGRKARNSSEQVWENIATVEYLNMNSQYRYDDQSGESGVYYDYKVDGIQTCKDSSGREVASPSSTLMDIGFSQPYGVVSGSVTYGSSKQAVKDVCVYAQGGSAMVNRALHFDGTSKTTAVIKDSLVQRMLGENGSIQFYLRDMKSVNGRTKTKIIDGTNFSIYTEGDCVYVNWNGTSFFVRPSSNNIDIDGNYTHYTFTYSPTCAAAYVNGKPVDLFQIISNTTVAVDSVKTVKTTNKIGNLTIGAADVQGTTTQYPTFFLDELRFWSVTLDSATVAQNYDRYLNGSEAGLSGYYRFDEDIDNLAVDLSNENGKYNGRHIYMENIAKKSDANNNEVPTIDQLAFKAYTDVDGSYLMNNLPYVGEGESYTIMPSLGVHKFSPTEKTLYFNDNASNHNNVDFTDNSSFDVSGVVYYENTTVPVQGCNFYVDGVACTTGDGDLVTSDENGEYTISVPIGEHYIQVKKSNHTFVNNGRYPEDAFGRGKKEVFENPVTDLTFYDNTLVTVVGKVVGGDVEGEKPHGFNLSKANIGRAEIKLKASDLYQLNTKDSIRTFASPIDSVKSVTTTGKFDSGTDAQYITILTDSVTGEFAVALPPLDYTISSIRLVNNPDFQFSASDYSAPALASANLNNVLKDSALIDSTHYGYVEYIHALDVVAHTTPTLEVTDGNHKDGLFGDNTYIYKDPITQKKDTVALIGADTTYTMGYPVFTQNNTYTLNLFGYERFVNYDKVKAGLADSVDKVPMRGVTVTLSNELGAQQILNVVGDSVKVAGNKGDSVWVKTGDVEQLADNTVTLDSVTGKAVYAFKATFPQITSPYTRRLNITYEMNNRIYNWGNGLDGIILGGLPTGNNFVTAGPDKVYYILRDPAGSNSFATLEDGSVITVEEATNFYATEGTEISTVNTFSSNIETYSGAGVGAIVLTKTVSSWTGIEASTNTVLTATQNKSESQSTTMTVTNAISTSDAEDYVGEGGDVFIGWSTNQVFGKARKVTIQKDTADNYSIALDEGLNVSESYKTEFLYTQTYIENTLIPNLESLRNNCLTTVKGDVYNSYKDTKLKNETGHILYLTKWGQDSEYFGTSNTDKSVWGSNAQTKMVDGKNCFEGPSYMIVLPESVSTDGMYSDTVLWYNQQIELWKKQLAANERAKVRAIEGQDSFLIVNKSFDAGSKYGSSTQNCSSVTKVKELGVQTSLMVGIGSGYEIIGLGMDIDVKVETTVDYSTSDTKTTEDCQTVSYELVETGDDDALSVDIYNAPDGFGPIFYTRAGQTSCPYEGEKLTRYYEPGKHTLAQATMKIESPEISCETPVISDVPSGSAANYTLNLYNNSDILEDGYYYLKAVNAKGANVLVDGASITNSPRTILLRAGEITQKKLQVKQTQLDVVDYDSISVVIASMCQNDETGNIDLISDTVYISAHFNPGCSPITLQIDKTTINTNEDELILKVKDFDRTYGGFGKIYLQYKAVGENDWNLAKSFALNDSVKKAEKTDSVITTASFNYPFNVNSVSFYDQTYLFRAATVCKYGTDNIYAYSDEITVVKDQSEPMALGTPSPSNGILNDGDDVYVVFNEPIKTGVLTKNENIQVRGVLNDYIVTHETAYKMQGTEAKTEVPVYCGSGDFTLETWLNYTKPGTLFSWGKGSLEIAINDDHKLVVSSNGEKIVSADTIRQNYWTYLSVSVQKGDGDTCYVSANYAYDALDVQLFSGKMLPIATTSSTLAVGNGMEGYMHELTLWNEYRPFASAKSQMYRGKYASTSGLIGYWPMNEGKGQLLTDKARSRHLSAPVDSWFNNTGNYAVEFSGSDTLNINISECPAKTDDNYLVELWFRGTETKSANLFRLVSSNKLSVDFTETGALTLTTADDTYTLSSANVLEGVWHHFALNVLRNGNAAVYIDGTLAYQFAASNVPAFAGSNLLLGAGFVGQMDEFRYWKAVRSADVIRENAYSRLSKDEEGLMAYYPFEADSTDIYNQTVTIGSAIDLINGKQATGIAAYTEQAPALTAVKQKESVAFTYTASDTKIVIDVTESAYRVDGCTLEFTVKRVQDLNGNYGNPITWTAYMNKNTLVWADDALSLEQESGEETDFSVAVSNNGGSSKTWYISDMPSWLSVDKESGTLSALSSKTLNFTVLNSTPIGYYEAAVLLVGEDSLTDRLDLSLKVTGVRPEWEVDPSAYELNMNVVATIKVDGQYSEDENDLVAAFIDDKCVGITSPSYFKRYDSYYVMMDVYGNADMAKKDVQFRIWDASTGVTFVCQSSESVSFSSNTIYGSIDKPIELSTTALQEQSTHLEAGWNWISMSVAPSDKSVSNVMKSVSDNLSMVKGKTSFAVTYNGLFVGKLNEMSNTKMYKVKVNEDTNWTLLGEKIDPTTCPITVVPNWNWIGYTPTYRLTLDDAFAGLNPTSGDVVKSSEGFAIYSGFEWVGSLTAMTPGKGYMYKSFAKDTLTFTYPSNKFALLSGSLRAATAFNYTPVADNKYPNNMTIIAVVKNGTEKVRGAEVAALVGEECRAVGRSDEESALVFLTIAGEGSSDSILFMVEYGDKFLPVPKKILYEDDAMLGTLENPYEINLASTSVSEVSALALRVFPTNVEHTLYVEAETGVEAIRLTDVYGRVLTEQSCENAVGTFTFDMSHYASGVYFAVIELADGQQVIRRVMK